MVRLGLFGESYKITSTPSTIEQAKIIGERKFYL